MLHGHADAAKLLLDGGADPDLPDSDGTMPLMTAAGDGNVVTLKLLLAGGAAIGLPPS